jgi:hypothetical protein
VEFSKYAPIETTLAKRGRGFAFEEPQPILGSTKDQLRVAYPTYEDAGAQRARIRLPKSICASIWTTVDVRFGEFGQAGKASSYSFDLKDDHCKTPKEELEKALSTFGSAGPDAKNPSVTLFSQDPIVALQQGKARWTIAVVGVVDHGEPS